MYQDVVRATRSLFLSLLSISAGILVTVPGVQAQAQAAVAAVPQIQQQVDNSQRTTLRGNVHPMARAAYDRGTVQDALQTPRMQLLIKRPADREAALKQYVADLHQQGSASYHKWLTPDQIGQQYGPADSDVQTVTAWLQSQGFTVSKLSRAKSTIEFSGTAGQLKSAFRTQIHKYLVNGATHYANATDPQIPTALTPVVAGVVRMNDFRPKAQIKVQGAATYSQATHQAKPLWNYPVGKGVEYFVAPSDFAVQYDTGPLTAAGINGTGQTIGIINDSNIDLNLVAGFRNLFNLTPANNLPNVVIDGTDPGVNGDAIEAYLDVEWSGAIAPAATVNLYIAADTTLNSGLDLAAARAVDDDVAKVLSVSFGECELDLGAAENAYYNSLWEQAAAQGQTVMISAGDSGSQGCYNGAASTLQYGLAVNGLASTPYNVAVGGTDFYFSDYASTPTNGYPPSYSNYWTAATSATPATSIKTVIPEQPWNNTQYGLNIAAYASGDASTYYSDQGLDEPGGGSGGASSCATFDANSNCVAGYPKPDFQSALTPADSVRDIPDVSLFAANGLNYSSFVICANPGDCNTYGETASPQTVEGVGGTSASSPSFAGIMALVNQKYGPQGQANNVLYPLAKQFPAAFHDVTVGSNNGPCYATGTNSAGQTIEDITACVAASDGSTSAGAYSAASGYDQASGLGSVDANVLVNDWNKVTFTPSGTTLALSAPSITHGASETLTATVTGATSGDVAFVTSAPLPSYKGLNFATVGSTGVATLTTNVLPGGTYSITADYGGNGTAAASNSAAQNITVTPENSNINLAVFQTQVGSSGAAATGYVTSGASYPYGTAIYADVQPVGTSVTQPAGALVGTNLVTDGIATGSATFSDTGSGGTATVALNGAGVAEWSIGNFAIGAHSITASYSGDASFNKSTSAAAVTFTLTKGTPVITVQPFDNGQQTGSNQSVEVFAQYLGVGTAPTGTVTVTLGGQTLTGTLAAYTQGSNYAGGTTGGYSVATVTFVSVPANVTTITATYPGDSNWNAATGSASFQTGNAGLTASTTTLTVTPSTTSINNATVFTLSSTVTGSASGPAPTGTVYFVSNGYTIATANLPTGAAGAPLSVTTTALGANILGGVNQIIAVYTGDTTYLWSYSAPTSATVDQSDFTLASQNQVLSIAAGSSGTATVNLASESGFDANVNLTCASPNSLITCSVSPGSVTVNGLATAAVTIKVAASTASSTNSDKRLWYAGSSAALACFLLYGIPARRRSWRGMLGLLLFAVLTANIGCGGGGTSQTPVLGLAATPTFSPAAGAVTSGTAVTLSDSTPGATIYYTTNGTSPTTASTAYSAAIPVTAAETINAIATASGYTQSAVGTAAYTITTTPTKPTSGTNPASHNVSIQVVTPSGTSVVVVTGTVAVS